MPHDQEMEASDDEDDEDEDDGDEDNSSGDQDSVSSPSITFDRRDHSWHGRVKGSTTGKVHEISRCVPMRDENKTTYTPDAFEARKEQIKLEVQKWMEKKQKQLALAEQFFTHALLGIALRSTGDCLEEH